MNTPEIPAPRQLHPVTEQDAEIARLRGLLDDAARRNVRLQALLDDGCDEVTAFAVHADGSFSVTFSRGCDLVDLLLTATTRLGTETTDSAQLALVGAQS